MNQTSITLRITHGGLDNLDERTFAKNVIKIGRDPSCDIMLDEPGIYSIDAEIELYADRPPVLSRIGRFGTILHNGEPVRASEKLASGDEIQIGRHTLAVTSLVFGSARKPADRIDQADVQSTIDYWTTEVNRWRSSTEAALAGLSKIAAALHLQSDASADSMVAMIVHLRDVIDSNNEILASYCPEVDPSRSSLSSTVAMLVGDVLRPGSAQRKRLLELTGCNQSYTDAELVEFIRVHILERAKTIRSGVIKASKLPHGVHYSDQEIIEQVENMARMLDRLTNVLGEDDHHARAQADADLRDFDAKHCPAGPLVTWITTPPRASAGVGWVDMLCSFGVQVVVATEPGHARGRAFLVVDSDLAGLDWVSKITSAAELVGGRVFMSEGPARVARIAELEEKLAEAIAESNRVADQRDAAMAENRQLKEGTDTAKLFRGAASRLVEFFYLLIRDELEFGAAKKIVRGMAPIGDTVRYCSPGGEMLARELVHELLTGEKPSMEAAAERSIDWTDPAVLGRTVLINIKLAEEPGA